MIDILQNYYPVMMLMVIILFLGILLLRYYEPYAIKKAILVMPADNASSTPYCNKGVLRIGSITLGTALVAGKKRVP
jgi:hypothetical protein